MVKLDARKSGSFKIGGDIEIHRLGFGAMRITGPRVWGPPSTGPRRSGHSNACLSLASISSTLRTPTGRCLRQLVHETLSPYDGILIATKAGLTRPGPGSWERDGRPDYLRKEAIKSREQLGLEQIGLWQLHSIDPKVPRDEQFAAVKSLQDDGIIRHAGLSNVLSLTSKPPQKCSTWRPCKTFTISSIAAAKTCWIIARGTGSASFLVSAGCRPSRQKWFDPGCRSQGS